MKKIFILLTVLALGQSNHEVKNYYVDIKGSVNNPDVYLVDETATINDVIILAGGLTKNSDTKYLNLAKKVSNEMVIYIPNKNEINVLEQTKDFICNCEDKFIYKCDNNKKLPKNVENIENISELPEDNKSDNLDTNKLIKNIVEDSISEISSDNNSSSAIGDVSEEREKTSSINLININTASKEELDDLPGIGSSTAQNIIDYRNQNGNFKLLTDIMLVKGIKESKYNEIKNYITIE